MAMLSIWKPGVCGISHKKLNFGNICHPRAIKFVTYIRSSWCSIMKLFHQRIESDDMYAHLTESVCLQKVTNEISFSKN